MAQTPITLVQQFLSDWHTMDVERLLEYFTDDAVYHNIPVDPHVGKDAIRAFFDGWMPNATRLDAEVHHILADGPIVVTERTDEVEFPTATVRIPIAGIFEIEDGKIARWREYFDMAQFTSQLGEPSRSEA